MASFASLPTRGGHMVFSIRQLRDPSLKRTAAMVDESENLGNEAAGTLKKQTDQMKENLDKLEVIEGQVDKAKKELNAFIRRMMTDKIILCFAILIAFLKKKKNYFLKLLLLKTFFILL